MAGFRKFQQTSCITHNVFIAVKFVHLPYMPFHTRLADDELQDLGSPSAAQLFLLRPKIEVPAQEGAHYFVFGRHVSFWGGHP
jgi:hypothetical protein